MGGSYFLWVLIWKHMENLGKTAVFSGGYGRIVEILHGWIWPDWCLNKTLEIKFRDILSTTF